MGAALLLMRPKSLPDKNSAMEDMVDAVMAALLLMRPKNLPDKNSAMEDMVDAVMAVLLLMRPKSLPDNNSAMEDMVADMVDAAMVVPLPNQTNHLIRKLFNTNRL